MSTSHLTGKPKTFAERTFYLAGPMSGYPQFNYPFFFVVAGKLRRDGMTIWSPAENDPLEVLLKVLQSPDGHLSLDMPSWGDFLAKDVKMIADELSGVILLPGWEQSRGALTEAYVALLCKKPLLMYFESKDGDYELHKCDAATVVNAISAYLKA